MESRQRLSLDRISTLPPHIIDVILSLLSIKDAVGTSILSREWRYSWTKIPVLRFGEYELKGSTTGKDRLSILEQTFDFPRLGKLMIKKCKFFNAVKESLLLHQGPLLEFSLIALVDETCLELDLIISHLSRRNTIKIFELVLIGDYKYWLPSSIFSFHQLTELSLRNCCIYLQPTFKGFGCLTSLNLQFVKITTKTLIHLVSSCPLLTSLILCLTEDVILGNDKVSITGLIECLPVIECLIIDSSISHYFFVDSLPQELPISLIHLTDLHIEDMRFLDFYMLPLLFLLIRCSPNLELINLQVDDDPEVVENFEKEPITLKSYSNIWLKNLNYLEIVGMSAFKLHLELVQLILAKSPMLKKVTLRLSYNVTDDDDEESNISRILLNSPRASGSAEIIVKPYR